MSESLKTNDCRNRAATKDCPFQIRPTSPLRFTTLLGTLEDGSVTGILSNVVIRN